MINVNIRHKAFDLNGSFVVFIDKYRQNKKFKIREFDEISYNEKSVRHSLISMSGPSFRPLDRARRVIFETGS
jgi:hypothetical protein